MAEELVIATDRGTITFPIQVGGNMLSDSAKLWKDNIFRNHLIRVTQPTGGRELAIVNSNTKNTLIIQGPWLLSYPIGSVYEILAIGDLGQVLRDVFGSGSNVSAANPLETHDPKLEEVEDKLDHPDYGLAALKALIDSLAGGAFYGSYGPKNVEVDNEVDFGTILYDPAGNIIAVGEITPGTYTIHRVRVAVDTEIVAAAASSEAAGRVYATYNFPAADWNVGDIFYITFTGIIVTIDGVVTEYPNLYIWGRVVREADISSKIDAIDAKVGTATDVGDLGTLFSRHLRAYLGTHTHVLVVVHDTSTLDADLDTALQQWLLDIGFVVTLADPTDVAGNLEVSAFDLVIVSASCVAADVGNLANLRTVEAPVICHSADIAASVVFDMGGTPHTQAAETQIEITDNTPMWLITQALGDLTVTASANIYAMNTKTAAAVTLAEEATGTGDHLTVVRLLAGDENEADYTAFYDRYFVGVGDYTNMNAVWQAVMEELAMHCVMEKRFTEEAVVKVKGLYVEDIPGTDFELAAIDAALGSDPPAADAENSIVDLDTKNKTTYVLRSLWVNITAWGTGTQMTFQLWVLINGVVTSVDSVVVTDLGVQNLVDLFGLQEVHADGIWITVITDAGNTGACSGTYRYAEAKE